MNAPWRHTTKWCVLLVALGVACHPAGRSRIEKPRSDFSDEEVRSLLPARLRRLSNAEYEATAGDLLGLDLAIAKRLPPDLKVDGYSRNGAAPVSSAYGSRLRALAPELGRRFAEARSDELSCPATDGAACAKEFIADFATRALRRPPAKSEVTALLAIYEQAREMEGEHELALGWVVTTLLQSPSLLYVSERGAPTGDGRVRHLQNYEIASALSYMLRGSPPDEALMRAAREGFLVSPREREKQARRLLAQSDTRYQFRRFVAEWLEVSDLEVTSKDDSVAPHYEDLKGRMLAETSAFVDEVMVRRGASVAALLTAGFSSVDPTMARYYGLDAWGPRVPSEDAGRIGLLQHASFLSAHAHPDGTSPIKRGDFVLRRILCVDMPRPDELGIEVVIPAVTETETTRERFLAHVNNEGCASCHDAIDPLGFAFEDFDAAGQKRDTENGRPIVTRGTFELDDYRTSFADSVDLSRWLARQPVAARCFRKHAIQFFAADGNEDHADAFEELVGHLPPGARESLLENLVAYAKSDLFLYRRSQP